MDETRRRANQWRGSGSNPLYELRDIFTDLYDELRTGFVAVAGGGPTVELRRTDDGYALLAGLPGIERSDIDVSIDGGTLTLTGERRLEDAPADARTVRRERWRGQFRSSVSLPAAVDNSRVRARLDNGLLVVDLPLSESARRHDIDIEVDAEEKEERS